LKAAVHTLFTFEQFLSSTFIYGNLAASLSLEDVMEDFAELMQRLLELQSGGRQRSPGLIAEDERLMDGLPKQTLAGKPLQTVKLSQDSAERTRFSVKRTPA
jgi:hypothetical protein